jgi:hypothetical protein
MSLTAGLVLATCLVQPPAHLAPQLRVRPVLSGETLVRDTADGRFKIHYTLTGEDRLIEATALDEDPANGLPDVVDWAEDGAGRMVAAFTGEDGWPAPTPDEGAGGDDRIDIYLRALPQGSNGFAHSETTPSGAVSGYLEVTPAAASPGRAAFASVVGHEVFHILEVSLARGFIASWIAEATATYAQYLLFTGEDRFLRLARDGLWQTRLATPNRRLDDLEASGSTPA